MKYNHLHPYTLLIISKKFLGIIAIPLTSQLLWFLLKEYKFIKNPIYVNVIVVVALAVFIFVKYWNEKIRVLEEKIEIKTGIIKKQTFLTYIKTVKVNKVEFSIISKWVGAYKLKLIKQVFYNELKDGIYINSSILYNILEKKLSKQKFDTIKTTSYFSSIILSIFWINPINILFISIPFLNKINKVLDDVIKEKIYSTLDVRIYFIALGMSPVIATVILVILILLFVSTFLRFLHYANFKLKKSHDFFYTESGFMFKYKNIINKSDINAISIKQSLWMKILRFGSIYYHTNRSKKLKGDNFLLLGGRYNDCLSILNLVGYSFNNTYKIIKFAKSLKSFIYVPLSAFTLNLSFLLFLKINYYNEIFIIFFELLELYIIWWTAMRILAYRNTLISINNKGDMIIKGYKGMSLIESYIKSDKIKNIVIRQNIFQKYSRCCNIYIYTSYNSDDIFFAKNLAYRDIEEVINLINISL